MSRAMSVAMSQYGVQEWDGIKDNPEVMKYFHDIGHEWVKHDETAWCAAFVNWVAKVAGFVGTGKLNARSFLDVGKDIPLEEALGGDVVVLWRDTPTSRLGHVGFLANIDKHYVYLLGGNQGNQINITRYPIARILGVRRLEEDILSVPSVDKAEIGSINSKQRVFISLTDERDYQDTDRKLTANEVSGLTIPDTAKGPEHWLIYMEEHIGLGKKAYYALNDQEAMGHIRKATALGVAAMEFNK